MATSTEASNKSGDHQETTPSDSGLSESGQTGQASSRTGLGSNKSEISTESGDVAATESVAMATDTALPVLAQEGTVSTASQHQQVSASMVTDIEQQEASIPTTPTPPSTDSTHTHTLTAPQTPTTPTHHKVGVKSHLKYIHVHVHVCTCCMNDCLGTDVNVL